MGRVDPWADTTSTQVTVDGDSFVIVHPTNSDALITEEEFVRDERMPYWADIWPASRALSARLLSERGAGRSLIELGCGLGLVSAAATKAGFAVLATDYCEDALDFTRFNVQANTGREPETLLLDWRGPLPALERRDVAVASDVLYERPYARLIAGILAAVVRPGGKSIIADPGRVAAPEFLEQAAAVGMRVVRRSEQSVTCDDRSVTVRIYELRNGASA